MEIITLEGTRLFGVIFGLIILYFWVGIIGYYFGKNNK